MNVAIPLFGNWISPRFGFSPEMWILTIEDGKVISQKTISMDGLALPQWFDQLASLGIDTLICGGIDGFCHHQLKSLGISVIPEIAGEASEALSLFLNGELEPGFRICRGRGRGLRGGKGKFFGPPWVMDDKKNK
jgi:predicted Fe-Mo cluster-binding NifX family protein